MYKIGFMRDGVIINEIVAPEGVKDGDVDKVAINIDELLHSTCILKINEEVATFEALSKEDLYRTFEELSREDLRQ
jgi:hypothetical protein